VTKSPGGVNNGEDGRPSTQIVDALRMVLISEREKAEAELQKLGRSKRAWRALKVVFSQEVTAFGARQMSAFVSWHNYTERHRRSFRTWLDAQRVRPPEDSLDSLWAEWWLNHGRRRRPRILDYEMVPSGWLGADKFEALFRNREVQPPERESAGVTTQRRTRRRARAWARDATLHLAWFKVDSAKVAKLLGPRTRVTIAARTRRSARSASLYASFGPARDRSPEDFARERKEHLLSTTWNETTQEWRNAERAALADAALHALQRDPLRIFAVGVSLGQSYLAEVHARQSRPNLIERAVLDNYSTSGRQTHTGDRGRRVKLAEAIVYSAAQKLARKNRGPDSTARLLAMNAELQRVVKELRGKPYAFGRLRQIVRDPAAARYRPTATLRGELTRTRAHR